MDKLGVFLCGMVAGAAALGTAAYLTDRFYGDSDTDGSDDNMDEEVRGAEYSEEDGGAAPAVVPVIGVNNAV